MTSAWNQKLYMLTAEIMDLILDNVEVIPSTVKQEFHRKSYYFQTNISQVKIIELIEKVYSQVEWFSFAERTPPEQKKVLGRTKQGIVASIRYRYGNLGEPSQDDCGWRCDCCGRLGGFTHWMFDLNEPRT